MSTPSEQDAGTRADELTREYSDVLAGIGWLAGPVAVLNAGGLVDHPAGSTRWAPRTEGEVTNLVSFFKAPASSAQRETPARSAGLVLTDEADIERLRALRGRVRADLARRKTTRPRTA